MAERVTAETVLQKISERHLECQICTDRFKEPKMLKCSHSFCLECLQQLPTTKRRRQRIRWITCPVCRGQTVLTEGGVASLRTDFKLTSLLDEIREHETELQSQQEIQPPSQESVSKCSKHTDKDVIMYCDSCKQLICTTCIAKNHRMHPATELNEVVENCKKKADKLFAEIKQHHINFNTALQDIAQSRKTLDSVFASTRAKISKKADEEIAKEVARIREEEKKLRVELEQAYKDRAKKIEIAGETNNKEMTTAKYKKDEVTQLMDKVTFSENLHLIEKLLQDLKDYTELQPTKVPHGFTYMDFEDDQKSLGTLVLKDTLELETAASAEARTETCNPQGKLTQKTWMLKTEITRYLSRAQHIQNFSAFDVASFSTSDIVVCDLVNQTLIKIKAESFSLSKVVAEELSIKGLTNPSRVTVYRYDVLIFVDNRSVKIFNRRNQLLHQFILGGQPSCIAVDDNNLIAVGFDNQGEISLYKPDGSLIRMLSTHGIGQYLTIHKQQLIYTNWADNKLVSIDYNGGVVFSVDIYQSRWPRGVCCDKDGSIYVALWDRKSWSGEIQRYSLDGKYIGCIIKGCIYPYGITLTPAGDLVVATYASVQIYMYHGG